MTIFFRRSRIDVAAPERRRRACVGASPTRSTTTRTRRPRAAVRAWLGALRARACARTACRRTSAARGMNAANPQLRAAQLPRAAGDRPRRAGRRRRRRRAARRAAPALRRAAGPRALRREAAGLGAQGRLLDAVLQFVEGQPEKAASCPPPSPPPSTFSTRVSRPVAGVAPALERLCTGAAWSEGPVWMRENGSCCGATSPTTACWPGTRRRHVGVARGGRVHQRPCAGARWRAAALLARPARAGAHALREGAETRSSSTATRAGASIRPTTWS